VILWQETTLAVMMTRAYSLSRDLVVIKHAKRRGRDSVAAGKLFATLATCIH
jgi:hypothetical protein